MVEEGGKGPQNTSETVDLSDPNKHCRLCAASFNNPHMAQQHYAGRKHQRNHSRQQLLKDLGEDPAQGTHALCCLSLCGNRPVSEMGGKESMPGEERK